MRTLIILSLLMLSACAGIQKPPEANVMPAPVTNTVNVQTLVPCLNEQIAKPAFIEDGALLLLDDATYVLTLATERLNYRIYTAKLEAVISACYTTKPKAKSK